MCGLLACLALFSFLGLLILPVTGNTLWTIILVICIMIFIVCVSTIKR